MVSGYIRRGAAVAGLALLVAGASNAIAQDYRETPLNGLPGFQDPTAPRELPGFSYPPKNLDNSPGFNFPHETKRDLPDFPTKNSIQCIGIAGYVKKHGKLTASGSNPTYTLDLSKYGFELKLVLNDDNPHDKNSSLEIKLKSGSETLLTINDKMCNGRIEGGTEESQRIYSGILDMLFSLMYKPKEPKKMA